MSWRERQGLQLFKGLALALPLVLGGCFQPLYGPLAGGGSLESELQAIAVNPIPERIGHYLENELAFALNGTGSTVVPKYRLTVALRERVQTPVIDTVSARATAATVIVDADYILTPVAGGEAITKGTAFSIASYDRTSQRISNLQAARDAETRNAKFIADQIRTRISAALASRG
ncbi:MAG: LPS-assembly lipoprotein [Methylobacteriaceae bacterium]|nr:LPS-assembly lipoprotein [Methylobacteriaceae bacterium]